MLQGMFDFFEQCRLKGPRKDSPHGSKVLELPGKGVLQDWFVPRLAEPFGGRHGWLVTTAEERKIHGYLANLYRLGIPSYLTEPHLKNLMKLFVPLEAYVKDVGNPKDEFDLRPTLDSAEPSREILWSNLKKEFVQFVLETTIEAALQMFGGGAKKEYLTAVFDACGYSPDADRWKISFRICFVEIAVTVKEAQEAREFFIRRLDANWLRLQQQCQREKSLRSGVPSSNFSWIDAVEPIQRPAISADNQHSFWASIVDDKPFEMGAQHRLVFCDAVRGDDEILLPEGRPLLPYGLFNGILSSSDTCVRLHKPKEADDLDGAGWAKLGSVWTTLPKTTLSKATSSLQERLKPRPARPDRRKNGSSAGVPPWIQWFTTEGTRYFHNPLTGEVRWVLPSVQAHVVLLNGDRIWVTTDIGALVGDLRKEVAQKRSVGQDQVELLSQERVLDNEDLVPGGIVQCAIQWREVPPEHQWETFRDGHGRSYFHNRILNLTEWELPAGAQLRPEKLRPLRP
jgi:hypothetical protein